MRERELERKEREREKERQTDRQTDRALRSIILVVEFFVQTDAFIEIAQLALVACAEI